tara:strand:- start:6669 stop:7271 length:603 start_codon:yes stop_codon:yes gene_type:complete
MTKKTLAERANQWMYGEEYLSAPQPSTEFDPFTPNYGSKHQTATLPKGDGNTLPQTDMTKDVDSTHSKPPQEKEPEEKEDATEETDDKETSGNKNLVKKMYSEMSELLDDVIEQAKNIKSKVGAVNKTLDDADSQKVNDLEGASNQLYEDIENLNDSLKSSLNVINSVVGGEEEEDVEDVEETDDEEETEVEPEEEDEKK